MRVAQWVAWWQGGLTAEGRAQQQETGGKEGVCRLCGTCWTFIRPSNVKFPINVKPHTYVKKRQM